MPVAHAEATDSSGSSFQRDVVLPDSFSLVFVFSLHLRYGPDPSYRRPDRSRLGTGGDAERIVDRREARCLALRLLLRLVGLPLVAALYGLIILAFIYCTRSRSYDLGQLHDMPERSIVLARLG